MKDLPNITNREQVSRDVEGFVRNYNQLVRYVRRLNTSITTNQITIPINGGSLTLGDDGNGNCIIKKDANGNITVVA